MTDNSVCEVATDQPICGIIMPISALGECSEAHWLDVRHILIEAIENAGFMPQMVSDADEIGVIQKRIIQNIYSNPIVVCDVSGKNPNVMFELGMRLAFDKPTIILKDDKTAYSFDTAPIEHLEYPRDLRFAKIVDFQDKLIEKIQATYKAASNQPDYTTFLKHFGTFTVPVLETKEVSKEDYILEEIKVLKSLMLRAQVNTIAPKTTDRVMKNLCLNKCSEEELNEVLLKLKTTSSLSDPIVKKRGSNHYHIPVAELTDLDKLLVLNCAKQAFKKARLLPNPR